MSEKKFDFILKRIHDKKVKATIVMDSGTHFIEKYIVELGDDYAKLNRSLTKTTADKYIKLGRIESVSTAWKE